MKITHLITTIIPAVSATALNASQLEETFRNPPDAARLWVYWTQSGDNSLESATADLEAMKRAGIGGVLRMDCSVGQVPGGTPFLGEEWRRQFVHSVHECERLGLEFTTITGPGWTGTGGPWISAEESMKHLVPVTVTTEGPAHFDQVLPVPQPRVSGYHRNQTPQMQKQISEYYRDVALFAFPRRDPVITDIDEKALFIRNPFTSMQGVRPHLPSPVSYPAASAEQVIDPKSIIDLTGTLQADGRLAWDVPPGEWTIVRLGVRSTGANTRPAPAAGLGLESDKFSRQALAKHFEAYFDPLLEAIGPRPKDRKTGFVALDADSWEMSSQNWTSGFREEFRKRCGYDPWLYFAAYTGCIVGSREETERFLWDVRKVCQELLLENHAAELKRLCHKRGLRLMMEPYDMNPAGDLDLGSYADFPAGEFWLNTFNSGWSCMAAASIAHTMGKPVVLAEGFTSIGNWAQSPWTLKNQTDWAFGIGINKFAIHGFAHQPNEDAPGMTFGPYGVFWNRKQTFWPLVGDYHEYLARCSHLLQQGVTVSDVLYLTPEGAPQVFQPPASALVGAASRLPDKMGYSFDGCSPRILMNRAEVRDGRIAFAGGTEYRLLVLPNWETMTPQLLAKIKELVEAGATVVGNPPGKSPSLAGYPACDEQVQELATELWGKKPQAERPFGKGRIILNPDSLAGKTHSLSLADAANWIWLNKGNPARVADVGAVHFMTTFEVDDVKDVKAALVEITADNSFTLEVNGREVLEGDNFNTIYSANILSALRSGENTVTVTANNEGDAPNPAGLIAAISITKSDGTIRVIASDEEWDASLDGTGWSAAMNLGKGTMGPWNLKGMRPESELYPSYAATAAILGKMGVPEDFQSNGPIRYTHRRTETEDIYFVSNTSDKPVETKCTFRVADGQPELWDPRNGERRQLPRYKHGEGLTTVPMSFAPLESFFVVFSEGADKGSDEAHDKVGENFADPKSVMEVQGPWDVAFDTKWGGPEKTTFSELQDWSHRTEEGIRHYSGIATYRKIFSYQLPVISDQSTEITDHRSLSTDHSRIYLDLGTVHELAEVTLNGKNLGVAWCAPWRVDVTDALKAGDNHLEIRVANLWVNRLIGDADKPPQERLTRTLIENPYKPDSSLVPSGLLGPVRVMK